MYTSQGLQNGSPLATRSVFPHSSRSRAAHRFGHHFASLTPLTRSSKLRAHHAAAMAPCPTLTPAQTRAPIASDLPQYRGRDHERSSMRSSIRFSPGSKRCHESRRTAENEQGGRGGEHGSDGVIYVVGRNAIDVHLILPHRQSMYEVGSSPGVNMSR